MKLIKRVKQLVIEDKALKESVHLPVPTNLILLTLATLLFLLGIIVLFFGLKDYSLSSLIASDLCIIALVVKVLFFKDLQ